jgi:radial spoke head protein 4A
MRLASLQADSRNLRQAGICFGEEDCLRIDMQLKLLYRRENMRQLRFWGKILGTKRDYYVAQGISALKSSDSVAAGAEAPGEGVNKYSYYVANHSLEDWIELPLITPEQLRTARKIKVLFTGDLEASCGQYPAFPGLEKHLLKAQLVRITHACEVVPKGLLKPND